MEVSRKWQKHSCILASEGGRVYQKLEITISKNNTKSTQLQAFYCCRGESVSAPPTAEVPKPSKGFEPFQDLLETG